VNYFIEIFDQFPDFIRGVVVGKGVNNNYKDEELFLLLEEVQDKVIKEIDPDKYREHPHIVSWREAYRRFGINPNKFSPSVEALLRQVIKGKGIKSINPLVDIFNYISLKYLVPSGGDDLSKVVGDLRLTYAKGDELFIPFGQTAPDPPKKGEVIYRDEEKVLCRSWNWRQGEHTKLTFQTEWVAINVDCLTPVDFVKAQRISEEVAQLVCKFCGGEVKVFIMDRKNPTINF